MAMTQQQIVQEIRAAHPVQHGYVDPNRLLFGSGFKEKNQGPRGIRPKHVEDALRHIGAADRYERGGVVASLVLARLTAPRPHTLLIMIHEYSWQKGDYVVEEVRRLYGPVPDDPTQALGHFVARYGRVVNLGDRKGLFLAHATVPKETQPVVEGFGPGEDLSVKRFAWPASNGEVTYTWTFAIREDEVTREEIAAQATVPSRGDRPVYAPPFERVVDTAVVVRGGVMQVADLQRTVAVHQQRHGFLAISVFAAEVPTYNEVVDRVPIPHPQLRWTTAGQVRDAGLELRRSGPPDHYDLVVPDSTEATLEAVAQLFGAPEPNPNPRRPQS